MSDVSTERVFVVRLSQKEADIIATSLLYMSWADENFPEAELIRDSLLEAGAETVSVRLDESIGEIVRE